MASYIGSDTGHKAKLGLTSSVESEVWRYARGYGSCEGLRARELEGFERALVVEGFRRVSPLPTAAAPRTVAKVHGARCVQRKG